MPNAGGAAERGRERGPSDRRERPFHCDGVFVTTCELREDLRCGTCGRVLRAPHVLCAACRSPAVATATARRRTTGPIKDTKKTTTTTTTTSRRRRRKDAPPRETSALLDVLYDTEVLVGEGFYEALEERGVVSASYGRFLREGLRSGDGALAKSGSARAVRWLRGRFPRSRSERRLRYALNLRSTGTRLPRPKAVASAPSPRPPSPRAIRSFDAALQRREEGKKAAAAKRTAAVSRAWPALPGAATKAKLPDIVRFKLYLDADEALRKKGHKTAAAAEDPAAHGDDDDDHHYVYDEKPPGNTHPLDDLIAELTAARDATLAPSSDVVGAP